MVAESDKEPWESAVAKRPQGATGAFVAHRHDVARRTAKATARSPRVYEAV